jgi:formate hydrogenlyase subunit 6/NADH:ubiquinone oxidoreductase subunit I
VEAEEYKNGNRFPRVYEIDGTRCIFCGFCEEICPVNAIKMGKNYEYVHYERSVFIFDTTFLVDQKKLNP